jgi:hypothetical protein
MLLGKPCKRLSANLAKSIFIPNGIYPGYQSSISKALGEISDLQKHLQRLGNTTSNKLVCSSTEARDFFIAL